jgi:sulfur carrier protein ThiS
MLSSFITRELLFFIFQKKTYKYFVDKKINNLINGNQKLGNKKINGLMVSLTSFPERIPEIKYTIYSLLNQSVLPEKIVLWLAKNQFQNMEIDLPDELLELRKFGLEIRWVDNLRSYTKLIPALETFPDWIIVTADDDIFYKRKWLEKLWNDHLKFPDSVVCHIAKIITMNNGIVLPYSDWKFYARSSIPKFIFFPFGVGGVLYSKKFLYQDVVKKDLFLKLSPSADDVWFYFMTLLNNTSIKVVEKPYYSLKYINPYREYGLNNQYKLSYVNESMNQNQVQIQNVLNYYQTDFRSLIKDKI